MLEKCCTSRMVFVWTVLAGLLFAGSLVLAFWGIPEIIKYEIHKQTRLTVGTDQWDRFVELPFPLDYTIRFFQVINKDDVLNHGLPPILNESEPYNYKLTLTKNDTRFDDSDEDSVTYKRIFKFEFDKSGPTRETDSITIINPLLMAALQLASVIERYALAGCLNKILGPSRLDQVFLTVTPRELLFDGIPFGAAGEELGVACEIVRQLMITRMGNIRVVEHVNRTQGEDYLRIVMFNYKTENYLKEAPDGIYTVNRGIENMTALGNIIRWNGGTNIPTYGTSRSTNNETCHKVQGTDSTIYHPILEKDESLVIYNTDICRTVKLVFKNSDESYRGIKAFRYETSQELFRPSTVLPEDDCFCTRATQDVNATDNCYLDGVFDFQPCLGAPVLVSQPHFLYADDKYIKSVNGLSPDLSKHGMYLLIEPNTGTPLQGMKRIQMNTVLRQEPFLSFLTPKTMYQAVIPVLWLEEGFSLPQEYVDLLNDEYFHQLNVATGLKYGLIAAFAAVFAACLFIVLRKEFCKNKTN